VPQIDLAIVTIRLRESKLYRMWYW